MKKNKILLIIFLLVSILPSTGRADISVSLKLDRSEATLVDSIGLVVSVAGTRKAASPPELQGVELFQVRPGGTSSRVEIVNGQVSSRIDYTYTLEPRHTGTFKIGPAKITVKGRTYQSNTVRLTVLEPSRAKGADRGPLFLTAEVSSREVFVEGQAVYILKLYRRANVNNISLNLPEVEGVSFTQLGQAREYQGVYNGQAYQIVEVRYALAPSKAGVIRIGPSKMNMTVFQPGDRSPGGPFNDPFFKDFFSFPQGRQMAVVSEPLDVKVLPLPAQGRPDDFSGLVGRFEMTSDLEPASVEAGESATLTVSVQGLGNVKHIPDLQVPELLGAKVYADQPVLDTVRHDQGLGGTKTMKWALVPEKEGIVEIPPLAVSIFDPESRQYKTLKTPARTLTVLPGEERQDLKVVQKTRGDEPSGPKKKAVKELGRDIFPIHTSLREMAPASGVNPFKGKAGLLLIAPLLIYGAALGLVKFRKRSDRALAAAQAKAASRELLKKCKNGPLSANELIQLMRGYLNHRFALSLGAVTSGEAAKILASRSVPAESVEKFQALFRHLEDAVYTGSGDDPSDLGKDLPEIIRRIEKGIR